MDRRGSANPTRLAVASILLGVLVVGGWSRAADPPAAEAENRLADDVVRWTAMLGSDRFDRRQAATRQLIGAGEEALPHLARAVYSEDLEVRYRAVYILQFAAQTKETSQEGARPQDVEAACRWRISRPLPNSPHGRAARSSSSRCLACSRRECVCDGRITSFNRYA